MYKNNPQHQVNPEDALEAYALDALDDLEALQVESHLEGSESSRLAVADMHHALSFLGQSVPQRQPSPALLLRLRRALGPSFTSASTRDVRPVWRWWPRIPAVKFLVPSAAAVVIALFSLAVVMNVGLANRTGDLERQNSTLTAQIAVSAEQDSNMADKVQELRVANQWLANPENVSLNLTPPGGSGTSSGVLVVEGDGSQAMLLLAGMEGSQEPGTYDVWLMRGADKVQVGTLQVDAQGWGSAPIDPGESVFSFDRVGLTEQMSSAEGARASIMVLEGAISGRGGSPMYTVQAPVWR